MTWISQMALFRTMRGDTGKILALFRDDDVPLRVGKNKITVHEATVLCKKMFRG